MWDGNSIDYEPNIELKMIFEEHGDVKIAKTTCQE